LPAARIVRDDGRVAAPCADREHPDESVLHGIGRRLGGKTAPPQACISMPL